MIDAAADDGPAGEEEAPTAGDDVRGGAIDAFEAAGERLALSRDRELLPL